MSTSLYWKPMPKEPKEHSVNSLKWALAKKLGDYDGSIPEDLGIVNSGLIPFLEGLSLAGDTEMSNDAKELIDAINKHELVRLIIH